MAIHGRLMEYWRSAGLESGDLVLVQSSLMNTFIKFHRTYRHWLTPRQVLDSFLAAVGDSGTLLFPLFNYDFTKKIPFDIRSTPSHMGDLTEAARKHPAAVRTGHPIYSFAAIGADASVFQGVDNYSGHGEDSPFGMLLERGGKIAALNLPDSQSMTFYHYVEEMLGVDYRYLKQFTGDYTDSSGERTERTYALFVRDLERGTITHVDPAGELMWQEGLYRGDRWNEGHGLRTIRSEDMFEFVAGIIGQGREEGLLVRFEKQPQPGVPQPRTVVTR